ncbi:MAG: hypothetical protein Q7T36_03140 [Fluviicoccus sp.]|uniref:hypothetical protein n=1 Tax=Fluviicoccus sp. TaxID=2003552 RepID=UPI0027233FB2|nr:hypothetical protein [Fluviicoccus sp.]MDO8329442.1 hypothetical protein [Fluviicoccus sp.]
MTIRRFGLSLLLGLTVAAGVVHAEDEDGLDEFRDKLTNEWMMVKNDRLHNIRTFARLEDGKRYRSMKVEATLDASLASLARVMYDIESYPRWFWKTRTARFLRKDSPTEFIAYMVHEAPVGLPDRDTAIKITVDPQSRGKPGIVMHVTAMPDFLPAKPPLVRVKAEELTLRFTPKSEKQVDLQVEGYFDPGGFAPAWAANFVQRNAPYSVILGLQRMANKEDYAKEGRPLPFKIYEFGQAIP